MIKKCLVCGADFYVRGPSDKIVTCSPACKKIRRSQILKGHQVDPETRKAIGEAAKKHFRPDMWKNGVEAGKIAPKTGRFETHSSAKRWTLLSPDGRMYKCTNLDKFIRDHADLFGIDGTDDNAVHRISSGFVQLKKGLKTGRRITCNKGWKILPNGDELKNCQRADYDTKS